MHPNHACKLMIVQGNKIAIALVESINKLPIRTGSMLADFFGKRLVIQPVNLLKFAGRYSLFEAILGHPLVSGTKNNFTMAHIDMAVLLSSAAAGLIGHPPG